MSRAALVLALLAASQVTARADVWKQAITPADAPAATLDDLYQHALERGDELALEANIPQSGSYASIKQMVSLAADAYRAAANAKPAEAEPYFRIGWLYFTYYFQQCNASSASQHSILCDPSMFNLARARDVIDAWNAAEQRAPLDPRFGSLHDANFQILFERAILETRLEDRKHLQDAVHDYETLIARSDGIDPDDEAVVGNLAETYMMLGDLDKSIDLYTEAARASGDATITFGLAVALDRDERGEQARQLIASMGADVFRRYQIDLVNGSIFYVPTGEKYYYVALGDEAFGNDSAAAIEWDEYLTSPAGAAFRARAKTNRDATLARLKAHPPPKLPDPIRLIDY